MECDCDFDQKIQSQFGGCCRRESRKWNLFLHEYCQDYDYYLIECE